MKLAEATKRELRERLRQSETERSDLEQRYQHIATGSHVLICTHDLDGVLLTINPPACERLGYDCTELIGRNLSEFVSDARREYFFMLLDRIIQNGVDRGILQLMTRDGRVITFQYHSAKVTENVETPYILGHAYDITELTALQERLTQLSVTDDRTGLYNRRGFRDHADARMQLAHRFGETLMLVFADVDGLKIINDRFGHAAGSRAIVDAADVLRDSFRQTDVICRLGGDEFVVLAAYSPLETAPILIADRVRRNVAAFNINSHRPYKLSLSLGHVPIDKVSGLSLDEIIAAADNSMYEQKRNR